MVEKQSPPSRPARADQPAPPPATPDQAGQLAGLLTIAAGQVPAAAVAAGGVAAGAAGGILAGAALARLLRLMVSWGYRRKVARTAVRLTMTTRRVYTPGPYAGPAMRANAAREPVYDAWFLLNTARRVQERLDAGKTPEDAVKPERSYVEQRERARERRRRAAEAVDMEADRSHALEVDGRKVLGWKAHPDDKTTWECVAADGRWFYVDQPPLIGYPGMPHGGTCRCWPVPATPGMMRGASVDEAVAAAQGKAAADHEAERYPDPVPLEDDGDEAATA